jgi:hypothetical protein
MLLPSLTMRYVLITLIAFASITAASAQQEPAKAPPPAKAQPPAKKPTTITMTGCVQKSEAPGGGYTLSDETIVYRLTGVDVRDYVGRRVEIVGGAPRKLKITGGLLPTPNVAGQAGAMDPARAATIAADSASVNGTGAPEFRVRAIKPITGSCTQ